MENQRPKRARTDAATAASKEVRICDWIGTLHQLLDKHATFLFFFFARTISRVAWGWVAALYSPRQQIYA